MKSILYGNFQVLIADHSKPFTCLYSLIRNHKRQKVWIAISVYSWPQTATMRCPHLPLKTLAKPHNTPWQVRVINEKKTQKTVSCSSLSQWLMNQKYNHSFHALSKSPCEMFASQRHKKAPICCSRVDSYTRTDLISTRTETRSPCSNHTWKNKMTHLYVF